MHVIDSSGWIEHFLETPHAAFFSLALQDTQMVTVPSIALYEVHKRLSKALPDHALQECLNVMRRGKVVALTDARAIAASVVAQKHKLAMADAIMYSTALEFKATFWTQDVDYKGLPSVQFLPKFL